MKPFLVYCPPPLEGWSSIDVAKGVWIKQCVKQAIDLGLDPALMPSVGLERISVVFPADLATQLDNLGSAMSIAPGRVAGMYVQALRERELSSNSVQAQQLEEGPSLLAIDFPVQIQAIHDIVPAAKAGRIVLSEVGTGVGKSRIAARVAQMLLADEVTSGGRAPTTRVVVATPTVSQCVHLIDEFDCLDQTLLRVGQPALPSYGIVLGRSHFVDVEVATEVARQIHEASGNASLLTWIAGGCKSGLTNATKTLSRIAPGICGLMEDWLWLASELDDGLSHDALHECELTEESSDQSSTWYQQLRANSEQVAIVICTHAMVAIDAILRARSANGAMCEFQYLIVDEAHQLEQEVANMASNSVSLHTLSILLGRSEWGAVRCKELAAQCQRTVRAFNSRLGALPMKAGSVIVVPDALRKDQALSVAWQAVVPEIVNLAQMLKNLSNEIGQNKEVQGWGLARVRINMAIRALNFILAGTHATEVSLSKVKRMASLQVGPRTVSQYLKPLWERLSSAVLMSATLYLPTHKGDSAQYLISTLALPQDRIHEVASIYPDWITNSVQLLLPDKDSLADLRPPSSEESSHEDMMAWLHNVAMSIVNCVLPDAKGGVMVLMSGYDRLATLADMLVPLLGDRLIVQTRRSHSLSRSVQQFRGGYATGTKPVLLVTGRAWTGLDLKDLAVPDSAAALDFLLSDLVVPNIPFGLNRTTTHSSRVSRFFGFESSATALLLRQGLGRLVRRRGLQSRRIWIFDSRVLQSADGKRPAAGVYLSCQLILEKYKNRKRFSVVAVS